MKTLLIMAGGTGGHVMPALAVAHQLQQQNVHIEWLGTEAGIEFNLVPKAGFKLHTIGVQGLRGTGIVRKLKAPLVLIKAAWQSRQVIKKSGAQAVLGMGGFASGPGGLMAWLMRQPLVIHEQNAIAGTTNRLLAKLTNRRLSGFAQVRGINGNQHTGNPVKEAIAAIKAPEKRLAKRSNGLNILVVGGSSGAQVFNERLPKLLSDLTTGGLIRIHHQCGQGAEEATQTAYKVARLDAQVSEFIDDMSAAYVWCDIVICRSGAMTVSEVAAAGVAAVFVPYPHAIDDHQWHNAQALVQNGAALCYRQEQFEKGDWIADLQAIANDRKRLLQMSEAAREQALPNASQEVAAICAEVLDA